MPPPPPPRPRGWPVEPYPVHYAVDYPERLNRLTTAFRAILALPLGIVFYVLAGLLWSALGLGWIAVFFTRRYPAWLFAALTGALAYIARTQAYLQLTTDRFPGFGTGGSPVHLTFDPPPDGALSRWRVLIWKTILLIPQAIVLTCLGIAASVCTIFAWFAILFTGSYPRGLFSFVTGVNRWSYRVGAYFASFTDRFPPYALSAEAGPASNNAAVASGCIGAAAVALFGILVGVAIATLGSEPAADVSYADLQRGNQAYSFSSTDTDGTPDFTVTLISAMDNNQALGQALGLENQSRIVTFQLRYRNATGSDREVARASATLRYRNGGANGSRAADLIVVQNVPAPTTIDDGERATVSISFAVPRNTTVVDLHVEPPWSARGGATYRFTR
jgi:hypothetical protein